MKERNVSGWLGNVIACLIGCSLSEHTPMLPVFALMALVCSFVIGLRLIFNTFDYVASHIDRL